MIDRHLWVGPLAPVRIPISFDVEACKAEIQQIKEWAPLQMYSGKWRCDWRAHSIVGFSTDPLMVDSPFTAMCKATGNRQADPEEIMAAAIANLDRKTVLTTSAVNFPVCLAVAGQIPGRNERVRINYLGPRSIIPKHMDPYQAPRWEDRKVIRFHVGVIVPEDCVFIAWGRDDFPYQVARTGEAWFVDTDAPHMVTNGSHQGRYNLVIDKFVTPELRKLLQDNDHAR